MDSIKLLFLIMIRLIPLPEFLLNKNKVYYPFGDNDGFDKKVVDWTHAANNQDRHSGKIDIADANSILGSNRLIKGFAEIEVIRQSCSISASFHSQQCNL